MPQRNETQRLHLAELYTRKMIEHAIAYKKLLARKMLNKPAHLDFYLLASGNIPTPAYLKIDGKNGGITCVGYAAGDGKVALQSALDPAVDFRSVYVLEGGHMGLMRSCLFAWNLLQILGS